MSNIYAGRNIKVKNDDWQSGFDFEPCPNQEPAPFDNDPVDSPLRTLASDYDPVDRPEHYNNKRIEVIEYIDDTVPDFYSYYFGNALKYLSRHMHKGSAIQDLEKCKWYIDRMIEDNK